MEQTQKRLAELADGSWIEHDVLNIVEKVQAYDPNLKVQYLDPALADDITDAPYRILEKCPDGNWRVVFTVWELDERVLERLYRADNQRGNILHGLDGANLLAKRNQERRYKDEQEALAEMVRDTIKSPKDTYSARNPVTGEKHVFTAKPKKE